MKRKRLIAGILIVLYLFGMMPEMLYAEDNVLDTGTVQNAEASENAANLELQSKAVILMEASTGKVIYEHNSEERLSPASITKIMTLILIFDALEQGKIQLEDSVTTSAYAKSMGGSQVFLEEGEVQDVETLIKCIIVASGNDASVAMAEYIAGSEAEFVKQMNARAAELGMENTYFEDCCGLTDSDGHYSSAEDVAIMSRELITKYPQIKNYSTIWMDNITHTTQKGTSEFGLANTNKLLKQYAWTTGLKTGSTSKAKYCVSATACKDDLELIAVIMAAPDYKLRFAEAIKLFEYGYSHCKVYKDVSSRTMEKQKVKDGTKEEVASVRAEDFAYLSTTGEPVDGIEKKIVWNKEIAAPVNKGDALGKIEYYLEGKKVGEVAILATENVRKLNYMDSLKKLVYALWL